LAASNMPQAGGGGFSEQFKCHFDVTPSAKAPKQIKETSDNLRDRPMNTRFHTEFKAARFKAALRTLLALLSFLSVGCQAEDKQATAAQAQDEDDGRNWLESIVKEGVIPKDNPLRRTILFSHAVILPTEGRAPEAFVRRVSAWPGRTVLNDPSVIWKSDALDVDAPSQSKVSAPSEAGPRIAALRKYLFTDKEGTVPTEGYARFLELDAPLEQLQKIPEADRTSETKARIQMYQNRINALNDATELASAHLEYTKLTTDARTAPSVNNAIWSDAFEDWTSINGYAEHSVDVQTGSQKSLSEFALRSIGIRNGPTDPIPPGAGRIIGVLLVRQPTYTLAQAARRPFFKSLRSNWTEKREFWFQSLPVLTSSGANWDDDDINIFISATNGILRWRATFIVGVTIQTSANP
jgi:hypothetical protein